MLRSTVVDRKTLSWIKDEVDATLKTVLELLDEYIINPQDTTPLKECISPLHRVKGAVQMVGIEGATILAAEMENLAKALADKQIKQEKDALEVLATGICQLPGYLDSLYYGHPDLPLVLLPMLNDFRASQDSELFTEGDFFSPNLSVKVPIQPMSGCRVSGDISTVAKKLRPGYLSGLLGVIREDNVAVSLERLSLVLDNLLNASKTDRAEQLWWVALGVVDSLKEQGIEASVAVKILLGRVDRMIKAAINSGEENLTEESANKIIKSLLYYIAQSQAHNDRVLEIKKTFDLAHTNDESVEAARKNLFGFNANLVETMTNQLNEELTTIKCELDVVMHGKGGSTNGMDAILARFSTVADVLSMLGMTRQKNLVFEHKEFLESKMATGEPLSEEELMGVATALLYVETSLSDLGGIFGDASDESGIPQAEYEKLLKVVAQEILEVIKQTKEEVDQYSNEPSNILLISRVPDLLRKIAGVMRTLNDEQQSDLSRSICHYIDQEIIINKTQASDTSLDLLADAITGLENYYQAVLEESVAPELGLEVAAQSLTELGYPPYSVDQNIPTLTVSNF